MKTQLIKALLSHAHGEISYHKANVNVYLSNPVGIGEHSDVMGAITNELERIAYYEDQVEVIEKHFCKGMNSPLLPGEEPNYN